MRRRRVKGHYERGRRASEEMQTCITVKALWVLSPWKLREKENAGSFYPAFYLSDQRFWYSHIRVVKKVAWISFHYNATFTSLKE